ncbi:MAG: hypothetical protein GY853_13450 [PVC group bacterium]|nr:hypothetical protein [PVC group bacterium]
MTKKLFLYILMLIFIPSFCMAAGSAWDTGVDIHEETWTLADRGDWKEEAWVLGGPPEDNGWSIQSIVAVISATSYATMTFNLAEVAFGPLTDTRSYLSTPNILVDTNAISVTAAALADTSIAARSKILFTTPNVMAVDTSGANPVFINVTIEYKLVAP